MTDVGSLLVVGGTAGIGLEIVREYADAGQLGDPDRSRRDSCRVGRCRARRRGARGLALDLSEPEGIAAALADVGELDHVVIAAIERDANTAKDYDFGPRRRLVLLKLVGYTEVVHTLLPRLSEDGSVVLFGGLAQDRPYPGSTTVSTINGGIGGLVHTLAVELAPIRVNALHPGIVGDSPFWSGKDEAVEPGSRPVPRSAATSRWPTSSTRSTS